MLTAMALLAAAPVRTSAAPAADGPVASAVAGDVAVVAAVTAAAGGPAAPDPAAVLGGTSRPTSVAQSALLPRPENPHPDVSILGGGILSGVSQGAPERRRIGVAASEALAIHLGMMGWNRWVGDAQWASVSASSIQQNLRSGWVRDDDKFWINQFGHPYQGTWAYGAARSAGLGFWTSTAFPVAASALWELAGETTAPAFNDQVTTSVAGIVLGEALWRLAESIRADGGTLNEVLAGVLSPMSALNGHVLGRTAPRAPPSTRWVLELGALAGDAPGAGWPGASDPPRAFAGVDLTWGLPGDPDLSLDEPFDHFVLQASYGAAADPVAIARGRGLLLGEKLEPMEGVRGLWGLFLSFDFDTTGPYRISTSALGVGTCGRAELGGGLALETTAIASAVLMGAAGEQPPYGAGRDYRFGPGEQLLVDVRVRADPRVSGGVTLRQYLVVGDGPGAGADVLVEASASVLVRIRGPHAIGAEAAHHLRRVRDAEGSLVTGEGDAVRVYYALVGGG